MNIKKTVKKVINFVLTPRGNVKVSIASISNAHRLENKRIVITGGASGFGLEMAKKFIKEGAVVIICGRNESKLKIVSEQLGERCLYLKHDVSKVEDSESFLVKATKLLGSIDCLVCNAGISLHECVIENVTIEGYDTQMNILMRANFFLAQAFIKICNDNRSNRNLLFISSMTGNAPSEIPYGIAKAGISSMVAKLNREHYAKGLRVNAIAPGMSPTELTKSYIDTDDGNMYCNAPCGRYFYPSEIAEVATWLLCDASRIIGGEVITCDGGCTTKNIWH